MLLHPSLKALLGDPAGESIEPSTLSIEAARAAFAAEMSAIDGQAATPPPVVPFRDFAIAVDGGDIHAREYRPVSLSTDSGAPALLYLHGGGWIFGGIDTHDAICRFLSEHAPCVVFSVEYRLAPEHPFPTPLNDALAAYQWLSENAAACGIDPTRFAVAGDSAGANLAFGVSRLSREAGVQAPCFQLLIYPVCDLFGVTASREQFRRGYWLDSLDYQIGCYIRSPADMVDPRASLRLADDIGSMPPTRIVTAGFDPLRDEGNALADKLLRAGVTTEIINYPQYLHGFVSLRGILPEIDDILRELAAVIARGYRAAGRNA